MSPYHAHWSAGSNRMFEGVMANCPLCHPKENTVSPTPPSKINPKVVAGSAAGAASIVLVYIIGLLGLDLPAEVASALTVLISTGAGYLKSAA